MKNKKDKITGIKPDFVVFDEFICNKEVVLMNKEVKIRNWVYKDLGNFGASIIETNGECSKRTDVTPAKRYIEDLIEENKQLKANIDEAIEEIKDLLEHWRGNDLVERDLNILLSLLERGKGGDT